MPKGDRYCQGDGRLEDGRAKEEGKERSYPDSRVSRWVFGESSTNRLHQRIQEILIVIRLFPAVRYALCLPTAGRRYAFSRGL